MVQNRSEQTWVASQWFRRPKMVVVAAVEVAVAGALEDAHDGNVYVHVHGAGAEKRWEA